MHEPNVNTIQIKRIQEHYNFKNSIEIVVSYLRKIIIVKLLLN